MTDIRFIIDLMIRTHRSLSAQWLWCMRACRGCLKRRRGSLGTSPIITRNGVALAPWAPVRASSCRKRNSKEDNEWMHQQIIRLPTSFIGRRREGRRYRAGEMVHIEWSYSMLSFWREERKGHHPFQKEKGGCEKTLVPSRRGDWRMQQRDGVRRRPTAEVNSVIDMR
jgi:hypothetical protein